MDPTPTLVPGLTYFVLHSAGAFQSRSRWRMLDKAALNRIFSNIINNAVKYSDGDLAVTLTTDGLITFSNTAKALTSVEVGRFFDRFYTVEVSRNSSGLGLSIARMLVERMGGSIEAVYVNGKLQIKISFPE